MGSPLNGFFVIFGSPAEYACASIMAVVSTLALAVAAQLRRHANTTDDWAFELGVYCISSLMTVCFPMLFGRETVKLRLSDGQIRAIHVAAHKQTTLLHSFPSDGAPARRWEYIIGYVAKHKQGSPEQEAGRPPQAGSAVAAGKSHVGRMTQAVDPS